jgi:hypothetical protein
MLRFHQAKYTTKYVFMSAYTYCHNISLELFHTSYCLTLKYTFICMISHSLTFHTKTTSVLGSHSIYFLPQTSENIQLARAHILLPSNYHLLERCMHFCDFKTHYKLLGKKIIFTNKRTFFIKHTKC